MTAASQVLQEVSHVNPPNPDGIFSVKRKFEGEEDTAAA